ncbi:MAG: hypothetical protein ABIA12_00495 [Candidatus Aenigmatarchaeota archaeon]
MVAEVVYSSNIQKLLGNAYLVTESSSMQLYYGLKPRPGLGHVLSFDPFAKHQPFVSTGSLSLDAFVRSAEFRDRFTGVKVETHPADAHHPVSHIDMTSWVLGERGSDFDRKRFGPLGIEMPEPLYERLIRLQKEGSSKK